MRTVLIIKLGYCETLVQEDGFVPSLGDVFRHTVLLHHYADYQVTWLTSSSAAPLLENNPLIHELLIFDETTPAKLEGRQFTEVLCLEKAETLCHLAASVKADEHLGFGWNGRKVQAHPMARKALAVANGTRHRQRTIQEHLFEIVGDRWNGEDYILGYQPTSLVQADIGLNYKVGPKWPAKAWPMPHWEKLAALCQDHGLSVSWQRGKKNLQAYMDWIHSNRLVVTCDSLGMHLGIALKKQTIALFGPTPSEQIYLYERGEILRADHAWSASPFRNTHPGKRDMIHIQPEDVFAAILAHLPEPVPA